MQSRWDCPNSQRRIPKEQLSDSFAAGGGDWVTRCHLAILALQSSGHREVTASACDTQCRESNQETPDGFRVRESNQEHDNTSPAATETVAAVRGENQNVCVLWAFRRRAPRSPQHGNSPSEFVARRIHSGDERLRWTKTSLDNCECSVPR